MEFADCAVRTVISLLIIRLPRIIGYIHHRINSSRVMKGDMVEHEPQRKKGRQFCLRKMDNLQEISSIQRYPYLSILSFPFPIPSLVCQPLI